MTKSLLLLGLAASVTFPSTTLAAGRQLTGVYTPAATPPLPPEEAARKMTLPDGFEARIFAAEPQVVNPVGMTWDERGRLWVVELYEYPLGAAPGTKPRDTVKILEDTDNDGRADKVTVFADGLNLATGILIGHGGVFVGQAPHLLFMQDTDGDDKADKTTIVKTGFGLEDRHELLNGFTWGPDGQLYMTHGVFTFSKVRNPDDPEDDGVTMTAAVARFHPKSKNFEVFAEGTSNPWGVDFDAAGNAFVSACVIDHLFHMAPGGIYQRQAGTPPHPYAYELLPSIVDHKHFRAAYAGVQVYQGDQYPEEYKGTVLMGNIHDNSIHRDRLNPDGSSFKASAMKDFVRANDGWFRPVSTQVGPDGAVWIMDWYDKYPCYQNANADPEGVDRAHGRIWRIVYTGNEKGKPVPTRPAGMNLAKASNEELVKTLAHPNAWQRRTAQRILSERENTSTAESLGEMAFNHADADARLAAFWTLFSTGQMEDKHLDTAAGHSDENLRAWAARFTGELRRHNEGSAQRLFKLAEDDSARVRLEVATALRQFVSGSLTVNTPPAQPISSSVLGHILVRLALHPQSDKDPVIPFMVWLAAEPHIAQDPSGVFTFLRQSAATNPRVGGAIARKTMRRLSDAGNPTHLAQAVELLGNFSPEAAPILIASLDGLIEGQKGKPFVPGESASTVLARLREHPNSEVVRRAEQLGTIWGDSAALQGSLKTAADTNRSVEERVQAIRSVRQHKIPAVKQALIALLTSGSPAPVANAAVLGLSEIGSDDIPEEILQRWNGFGASTKAAAAEALSSRGKWAQRLLSGIESKAVVLTDIPAPVVRSLVTSKDDYVRNRAIKVIGRFRESTPDKAQLIAEKKAMVLKGPVDLKKGHEVAQRACLTCHKLHGEGADVGPDITGVGRSSLDALLANVIDPNQLIGAGYENVEVETKDGRIVGGRMVENTDTRVKIISAGPKEEVISKGDIDNLRISEMSVMPEGLEQMPDEDFRNLIWYILNPPQDDKTVFVIPGEQKLTVKARLPGKNELVDLVTYVTDPKLRPYLHPVMDPTGEHVLTQDRPGDHVWQHGIFTGLHRVNGLDFWSEKQGQQRFVRLLNVVQEQDHVGWQSLTEWVAPDGKVVLEEEQSFKLYAVTSPWFYTMDFDWTLRPRGETVTIGKYEYGGFAVRMDLHPEHTHLNANGETAKDTSEKRAPWCNVSRPFGDQTLGITVFDHPSNAGFPAAWRVDGQGLINPSPSLQGDWVIEATKQRTYHYRVAVHAGPPNKSDMDGLFNSFSAVKFDQFAGIPEDAESIVHWNPEWKLNLPDFENSPKKLPEFMGRRNVLLTHPYTREKPSWIERTVSIPAGKRTQLEFAVAAHEKGDWELRVFANDTLLKKQTIDKAEDGWKKVSVDLSGYAGKTVTLRLENAANNWSWEFGYWHDLRFTSSELQRASK